MPVHLPTVLICAALLLLVGGIVYNLIRGRKKGRSCGCGGSCGGCPMGGACHGHRTDAHREDR